MQTKQNKGSNLPDQTKRPFGSLQKAEFPFFLVREQTSVEGSTSQQFFCLKKSLPFHTTPNQKSWRLSDNCAHVFFLPDQVASLILSFKGRL